MFSQARFCFGSIWSTYGQKDLYATDKVSIIQVRPLNEVVFAFALMPVPATNLKLQVNEELPMTKK